LVGTGTVVILATAVAWSAHLRKTRPERVAQGRGFVWMLVAASVLTGAGIVLYETDGDRVSAGLLTLGVLLAAVDEYRRL
jgi:hypothetical protein